jgi:hypothetical protein
MTAGRLRSVTPKLLHFFTNFQCDIRAFDEHLSAAMCRPYDQRVRVVNRTSPIASPSIFPGLYTNQRCHRMEMIVVTTAEPSLVLRRNRGRGMCIARGPVGHRGWLQIRHRRGHCASYSGDYRRPHLAFRTRLNSRSIRRSQSFGQDSSTRFARRIYPSGHRSQLWFWCSRFLRLISSVISGAVSQRFRICPSIKKMLLSRPWGRKSTALRRTPGRPIPSPTEQSQTKLVSTSQNNCSF